MILIDKPDLKGIKYLSGLVFCSFLAMGVGPPSKNKIAQPEPGDPSTKLSAG